MAAIWKKVLTEYYTLTKSGDADVKKSMSKLPLAEIQFLGRHLLNDRRAAKITETDCRRLVVLQRLVWRRCSNCGYEQHPTAYQCCDMCCMTWYCSDYCRQTDQARHSRWCCNSFADIDYGPAGFHNWLMYHDVIQLTQI
jgi:hypothetical protein